MNNVVICNMPNTRDLPVPDVEEKQCVWRKERKVFIKNEEKERTNNLIVNLFRFSVDAIDCFWALVG